MGVIIIARNCLPKVSIRAAGQIVIYNIHLNKIITVVMTTINHWHSLTVRSYNYRNPW